MSSLQNRKSFQLKINWKKIVNLQKGLPIYKTEHQKKIVKQFAKLKL